MNRPDTFPAAHAAHAAAALSHPGLIRLISEIDDNGPLPRHMLARTFPDLAGHQVRHALAMARDHGLMRTGQHAGYPCRLLTDRGTDLADVYDTAARWARSHHYPAREADFVTRVRATLAVLTHQAVIDALTSEEDDSMAATAAQHAVGISPLPHSDALADLQRPWAAFTWWVKANPSILPTNVRDYR